MTLQDIAAHLGVTKSFVSLVKNQKRGLTIDHLRRIELAIGYPLPLLLIESTDVKKLPANLRTMYASTRRLLQQSTSARAQHA
jgi:transcriptional regulator with XRE-family HTH domain